MKKKSFKSLNEQIEVLTQKGLKIYDYEYARDILLRENYFFLSGYRYLFLDSNNNQKFIENTTFDELYALFNFDRQIRNIIFKNILIFENNIKSVLSYVVSKNHGFKEQSYLNAKIFDSDPRKKRQIGDLIQKMKRQINVNGKQHSATSHYMTKYGFIPLWVVVKVLSFGITGELFLCLNAADKQEIADNFNVDNEDFASYLPILANYRNLCAHEDICYENKTQKSINDTKYHYNLYIPRNYEEYLYGKNDLFALIIIFKQVLIEKDFILFMNEFNYEIDKLAGKLEVIEINKVLDKMGFPMNYKQIIRMD